MAITVQDDFVNFGGGSNPAGQTFVRVISNVPTATSGDASLQLRIFGDFDDTKLEDLQISIEGYSLGTLFDNNINNDKFDLQPDLGDQYGSVKIANAVIPESVWKNIIRDGKIEITYKLGPDVNDFSSVYGQQEFLFASFTYDTTPLNHAPVSGGSTTVSGNEDTTITGNVPAASDVDGDTLTYALVQPVPGLTLNANGTFSYTPAQDFNGKVTFDYVATDGKLQSVPATVTINVLPVNDAPIVLASHLNLGGCDLGGKVDASVLDATDLDSPTLTWTVTSLGAGTLLLNGQAASLGAQFTKADIAAGRVQYLAGPVGPDGKDSIGLSLSDGDGATVPTSLSVTYAPFDTLQTAAQWGGYWGGAGNDYQQGTAGADNMFGGNGCDLQIGGGGNDQINGGEGNNRAFGQDGNDMLSGGSGNDLLDGGTGDDQLHANGGANWLFGGSGNDVMTAGDGSDHAYGGEGNDTIHLNGGDNRVDAGAGNDLVTTGSGDDVIIAGAGDDLVYAGSGTNTFQLGGIAGALSDGNDSFTGGSGADRYVLFLNARDGSAAGWGTDTVMGFRMAEGDRLVAFNGTAGAWDDSAFLASMTSGGTPFITGTRSADGGDLRLDFHAGEVSSSIVLKWFFWDNAGLLTASERATGFGQAVAQQDLAHILLGAMQDGGVSGPDFVARAHDTIAQDFLFA